MSTRALLEEVLRLAAAYEEGLPERHVGPRAGVAALREVLGGPLPERGEDPRRVITALARDADPGVVAMAGPRYFGFVTGGRLPVALAADWLTSTWDQNGCLAVMSPAVSVLEEVAGTWVKGLLGIPQEAGVGFVTGSQVANFTAMLAARNALLRRAGWDLERDGVRGSPPLHVVMGEEAHSSVQRALRYLGVGTRDVHAVPVDAQGRLRAEALGPVLARLEGPVLVCAQAGNVNTGACDALEPIADACERRGAWLHVDGAFGLWAAAAPARRHLVRGLERAQSWALDAHKWLNVPYDSAMVAVQPASALKDAISVSAAYLPQGGGERNALEYGLEMSRRARGLTVYAALRSLGREGVAELVERCCRLAARFAERLAAEGGVQVLNEVVLNQALVRFAPAGLSAAEADALTRAVIARVQQEGTCWLGGTVWQGVAAVRLSVSNASTREADIDRSAEAVLAAYRAERGAR
ncbi:aspartate aminotransferase family protein [Aggregicoccus sp. 17bor-14]|uniref:pyridoxal phosphate-dependent decarboxylase family protein n=1 Tax=Myxococcaceae TaxID=31 RepID=UPI00129CA044|nr:MULTISPECIES: pyridoxal-dependent decarboxylase [Myxococcaceae]MBF5042143.1 aspartate aminotransferase family protein [Simulacricoccus sp. 17bor-14]MRI87920.1 aspartate aminotransferase family protein [Aggregicoccus sp. 17bor-14]